MNKETLIKFMETGDYSLLNPQLLPNGKKRPRIIEKIIGRNEPCSCGSGLKFKKCCGK